MLKIFNSNDPKSQLERAMERSNPVICEAVSYNNGILNVRFGNITGTMSESLDDTPYTVHPSAMVGSKIALVPTFVSRNDCQFSLKAAREWAAKNLAVGDIINATVTGTASCGFFAATEYAVTIFVPIQDCCIARLRHASEIVSIREEIKIKISDFDPFTFAMKGNYKSILGDPIDILSELDIKEGSIVKCMVLEKISDIGNGYYVRFDNPNLTGIADLQKHIDYGTTLGLYVKKIDIADNKVKIKLRPPYLQKEKPVEQPPQKPPKKATYQPEERLSPFAIYSPTDYKKFVGTPRVNFNYVESALQNGLIQELDYAVLAIVNEYTVLSASQLFSILQAKFPSMCETKQRLKRRLEYLASLKMLAPFKIESDVFHSKSLYYTLDLNGRSLLKEQEIDVKFKQTSNSMPLRVFKRYLSRNAIAAYLIKEGIQIQTLNLDTPIPGMDRGSLSVIFPNGEHVLYEISRRYTHSLSGSTWIDSLQERLDAYNKITSEFDYLVINCDNEKHMKEAFELAENIIKNSELKVLFSHDTLQLDVYNSFLHLMRDDNGEIITERVMLLGEKPIESDNRLAKDELSA